MDKTKLTSLAVYVRSERGRVSALARRLGISDSYLSQMISGLRPMPPEMCPLVEEFSGGAVSRKDCRPKDGHLIWPDLIPDPRRPELKDPQEASHG